MKSYGSLYVGTLQYYHRHLLPIAEKGWTQETEMPYRKGACLVFRLPFTHTGYYVGKWSKKIEIDYFDEESIDRVLFEAIVGREAWTPEDGMYDEHFKE